MFKLLPAIPESNYWAAHPVPSRLIVASSGKAGQNTGEASISEKKNVTESPFSLVNLTQVALRER